MLAKLDFWRSWIFGETSAVDDFVPLINVWLFTFQNLAVEACGEGVDVEAPAADVEKDWVDRGEDAHQLAGQFLSW